MTDNTITVVIITVKDIITIDIKDKDKDIIINKKFIIIRSSKRMMITDFSANV